MDRPKLLIRRDRLTNLWVTKVNGFVVGVHSNGADALGNVDNAKAVATQLLKSVVTALAKKRRNETATTP
jgi:hypothetical protein